MNDWEEDVINTAGKWEKDLLDSKKKERSLFDKRYDIDDITSPSINDTRVKTSFTHSNRNEKSLKDSIDAGIKIAKTISKSLTKNRIPKNHDEVIAMKERLEHEEKQLVEKNKAIQVIKELQARKTQREYLARLERRDKIKRLFHL